MTSIAYQSIPNTNSLTHKWEATGLLHGLDPAKKDATAALLEEILKSMESANFLDPSWRPNQFATVIFPIARLISEKKDGLSARELISAYRKWYAKQTLTEFSCFGSPASIDQEKVLVDKFVAEYLAS